MVNGCSVILFQKVASELAPILKRKVAVKSSGACGGFGSSR